MTEASTNERNITGSAGETQALRDRAGNAKEAVKDLAGEASRYASRRMSDAKESATQWARAAKDKASTYSDVMGDYIQQNPYKSLAIAAGAGLLLGLLMKRR